MGILMNEEYYVYTGWVIEPGYPSPLRYYTVGEVVVKCWAIDGSPNDYRVKSADGSVHITPGLIFFERNFIKLSDMTRLEKLLYNVTESTNGLRHR